MSSSPSLAALPVKLGVIGGSGLYQMAGLTVEREHRLDTPFGKPSDCVLEAKLDGRSIYFLPRHGRGHRYSPSEVNYRANIHALKQLGVTHVVAVSAVGIMQESIRPGDMVIPDQLFDRTNARALSFFDDPSVGTDGLVVHVGLADPFCAKLNDICYEAAKATGNPVHKGGSFVTIEGPRFSTKAESRTFRSWGMDIIGMTTTPEAQLAREAEMSYSVMAHVTDYDVWHEVEEAVTVEAVVRVLRHNAEVVQQAVVSAIASLRGAGPSPQANALQDAIITQKDAVPDQVIERLAPIVGKYFDRKPTSHD